MKYDTTNIGIRPFPRHRDDDASAPWREIILLDLFSPMSYFLGSIINRARARELA